MICKKSKRFRLRHLIPDLYSICDLKSFLFLESPRITINQVELKFHAPKSNFANKESENLSTFINQNCLKILFR